MFQTYLAPRSRKQGSYGIGKQKSSFMWFCSFCTYLTATGKLLDQCSPSFQEIGKIYAPKYAESLRSYFFHTMATGDLLVIWADYNSGGLIKTLLPYDFCCRTLPQLLVAEDHKILRVTEGFMRDFESYFPNCGMKMVTLV